MLEQFKDKKIRGDFKIPNMLKSDNKLLMTDFKIKEDRGCPEFLDLLGNAVDHAIVNDKTISLNEKEDYLKIIEKFKMFVGNKIIL